MKLGQGNTMSVPVTPDEGSLSSGFKYLLERLRVKVKKNVISIFDLNQFFINVRHYLRI